MWNPSDALDLDEFEQLKLGDSAALLPIQPFFFIPPLDNKPQDPIIRALNIAQRNRRLVLRRQYVDLEPLEELGSRAPEQENAAVPSVEEFWANVGSRDTQDSSENRFVSWDRLRETHAHSRTSTAFLSEQDPLVFAAARHSIKGTRRNNRTKVVHVSEPVLRQSLRMLLIGTTSTLFSWDQSTGRFKQTGLDPGTTGQILIEGTDEVVSASILTRFLTIGTLLRRMEGFIGSLNQSMAKAGPTLHAFAHALSTTLSYLRTTLAGLASLDNSIPPAASWAKYAIYEGILKSLSELYGRSEDVEPAQYPTFEPSAVKIISRIYHHLSSHCERQSPREVQATFAYILDTTSKEYLHQVGVSVGFGGQPQVQPKKSKVRAEDYYIGMDADYEGGDGEGEEEDLFAAVQTEFPEFFPKPLLDILPAAQKSLILLKKAQSDHPLLSSDESTKKRVKWFWTDEEITAAWVEAKVESGHVPPTESASPSARSMQSSIEYPPEIAGFKVYDMEPGDHVGISALHAVHRSSSTLSAFIDRFPAQLPYLTPTLSHLTFLVLRKLLVHSATLSSTLLSLFLNSPGNLNFQLHLELLRSYLLVTAPGFRSRMVDALLSDAGEYEIDNVAHSMSLRSIRRRTSRKDGMDKAARHKQKNKQPWAVGISPNLLEREIWPPVSGDLSFFLRTVIVDSLNLGEDWDDEEARKNRHIVYEEAIWRIGFAIRDLPTGPGRDKWLNPLYIEALDFLYMDYKPPKPLNILISPDILHKYQRIFAFILRLLRVESALKSLFRITRGKEDPTFQNLPQYRKLFLHFRFIAQSFVAGLVSYVFDTAIKGNFDPFVAKISPSSGGATAFSTEEGLPTGFTDVFELAKAHSKLLDDILSACLLRTGQKAVSELMRHSLECVLEFCVVIGELERKRIEEYRAAPLIEDLYKKFKGKMALLTKALNALAERGPGASSKWPVEVQPGEQRPVGGSSALYHLLMRLDLGEWWLKGKPKRDVA